MTHPEPAPDAALEAEAQRQQTALLYRNAGVAQAVNVVIASLLALVNATLHLAPAPAFAWWAVLVAIAGGRYLLARRFQRAAPDAAAAAAWRHRYIVATTIAAVAWGAGAVLFMWHAPADAQLFTALVLAGLVAGAVPILATVPLAFRAFTLPILLPLAAAILLQAHTPLHWAFGAMTLVFLGAVLASARYLHETLDRSIRLGLEQGRLAASIRGALAERERAEATLRASEEHYRAFLHDLPTGVFHYDPSLVITFCNRRLAEILRAPEDRLVGLDMKTLDDQRVLPALRAALEGQEGVYEGEYVATLSGVQLWVSMRCTPLRGPDGQNAGGIAIVEDITDRKRSEEEIRHLAYYDPLTRLPNRRLLMDRLGHALAASKRSREYGALMILDLDHFKALNDTQGHDIGDRLLVEVGRRLVGSLRQEDTVSRLGGDEYVVMLEGLGQSERSAAAQAEGIAEKIRFALSLPYVLGGSEAEYFTTTSVGLTLFRGQDETAEILLKHADVALYRAKDAGRNAIRFFSPAMQSAIESRAALEAALRRGLDRNEFRLHFQPQVDRGGRLTGAEALLRWQSPTQGLVPPTQFIALAEESGLILALGEWVLDSACAQLAAWQRDPRTRDLTLSANVSSRQFLQPDFVEQLRHSLLASGADPTRLKLELTESVVLGNLDTAVHRMQELDALGVGFALDDFGTGYSSLAYLKRLPLDQIKIDQSFVRDIPGDANDAAIVRAILAMSRSLGLEVIAEGVETDAQHAFLLDNGCHAFQGYLFGRPLPIEEWAARLAAPAT